MSDLSRSIVILCAVAACADGVEPGREPEPEVREPIVPDCRPPQRGAGSYDTTPYLPEVAFEVPVDVVWAPGDRARAYVVEATGRVRMVHVDDAPDEAPLFLSVAHHLERYTGEMGLWDIAFHPRYPDVPYVYAFLSGTGGETDFRSMLLRFTVGAEGVAEPASETMLLAIERPYYGVHSGGKIGFSRDGLLWISTGDGGFYGDPLRHAQDPQLLLGKMLRIDVDGGEPYAIPATNPFAAGGAAPEIAALGLRNPWRWSFDRVTDEIWIGDVGHERVEEIDRFVLGGNYGWNLREGTLCGMVDPCPGTFVEPVHTYTRDQGTSVTGGYVYRGAQFPELYGRYIFGDYSSGRVWALTDDGSELLSETGLAITAFAEDPDGELLLMDGVTGQVYTLARADAERTGVPPRWLLATHCLTDPQLVPYTVNTPLWSDGTDKWRHLLIPDGSQARVEPDGTWDLPAHTVLVKTFVEGVQPIETRLLVRGDDGEWTGWSYRWLPDGTNAFRLDQGEVHEVGGRMWTFPSSNDCSRCHSAAAGRALGIRQAQLDRGTQLADLEERGLVDGARANVRALARLDAAQPLAGRARSYVDANCSMCHRPGGPAQGNLDLRAEVPLADTNTCNLPPSLGDVGLGPTARLIAPGAPQRSVLLARMSTRGAEAMPPLATHLVDDEAAAVLGAWIASLTGCD